MRVCILQRTIITILRGESVDEVSFIISGSLEVIQDDEVSSNYGTRNIIQLICYYLEAYNLLFTRINVITNITRWIITSGSF